MLSRRRAGSGGRRVVNALLVLASILATVVAIDLVAFYVLDVKRPGYRPDRFFQFSETMGHFHKPNAEGYWYRYRDGSKFYVRINGFGLSDAARAIEKTRPRIALIGDSTTEGWEADEGDRPHDAVERALGGRFEVLNFGVRGYGTDQTYLLFTTTGARFTPDVVVYTFCVNDFADNATTANKPYFELDAGSPDGLRLRGYPIQFLGFPIRRPRAPGTVAGLVDDLTTTLEDRSLVFRTARRQVTGPHHPPLEGHLDLRPFKQVYDDEDRRRETITLRLISLLDAEVKRRGMKFLMVEGLFRPVVDAQARQDAERVYGARFDFDRVSARLERHCRERGIECLSLPRMIAAQGVRAADVMRDDETIHLDRRGIAFYGRAVAEKLRALRWVE